MKHIDVWKHGIYIDTWSIVHFLSGFLLAGGFYMFEVSLLRACAVSVVLLIVWEMFEWITRIIEPSLNVAMDLIIGALGFALGAYLFYILHVPFAVVFYTVLSCTFALSVWGFVDFLKRGYR